MASVRSSIALMRSACCSSRTEVSHATARTTEQLLRAVRAAVRGQSVLSPSVASRLMTQIRTPAEAYAKLSVSDRAAAVAEAFNRGLLTPREAGR